MSFGFLVTSGTGASVTLSSAENPPGVYLDSFTVAMGATITRSYATFVGSKIFTVPVFTGLYSIYAQIVIAIDNVAKTVSVTNNSSGIFGSDIDVYVVGY